MLRSRPFETDALLYHRIQIVVRSSALSCARFLTMVTSPDLTRVFVYPRHPARQCTLQAGVVFGGPLCDDHGRGDVPMIQSVLLVVLTAVVTWFVMQRVR